MNDPLGGLVFLAPFAPFLAAGAVLTVFVVIWSLARRWPLSAGLSAEAWSIAIWLVASWLAGYVQDPTSARGAAGLVGAVLTAMFMAVIVAVYVAAPWVLTRSTPLWARADNALTRDRDSVSSPAPKGRDRWKQTNPRHAKGTETRVCHLTAQPGG